MQSQCRHLFSDVVRLAGGSAPRWAAALARTGRRAPWAAATTVLVVGSATVLSPVSPASAASPANKPLPNRLGGREWSVVPTQRKFVALTFDAGANADGMRSILATLTGQHVPATFFLTGNFVEQFKAQSRAIVAAGERIGDHSITHPYFTKLTDAQMRHEVLGAESDIISVTGADPWPWFRFPFGDRNAHTISVVNSVGFVPVSWTVDTLGWKGTSGGITVAKVIDRVLANLRPGEIVLMHCGSNPTDHSTLDASALPTVIRDLRARGYSFVTLDALLGYHVVTSNGDVSGFGVAGFGSDAGRLPAGVTAVGLAADSATGGYRILKSNGGVDSFGAPWHGSLAGKLGSGQSVTAIAAAPRGGYLILTSDGDVHAFGTTGFGSDLGRLPAGVTAVGLAADPATGGYRILKSNGGVDSFGAPWHGSLAGKLGAGQSAVAIATAPGGGYLILTSDGNVRGFGAATFGSDAGKLPAGGRAIGLAADAATGGYWIGKSNGGVDGFNAPWYGSLAGKLPAGRILTAIAGA